MKPLKVAKINFLFSLLLAFFLVFLSFNLCKLARESYLIGAPPTLINNSNTKALTRLSKESQALQSQFEFMVFDKERKQIHQSLIEVLKKQINLSPFDVNLWRQLNYWQFVKLSDESNLSIKDKQWTVDVAMRFLDWNQKERRFLITLCIELVSHQAVDVNGHCRQLFNIELQRLGVKAVKRNFNISEELWNRVALHYSLSLGGDNEK